MLINLSDVLSEQHKTVDETVQLERASYSCGYRVMYSDSM